MKEKKETYELAKGDRYREQAEEATASALNRCFFGKVLSSFTCG